MQQEIHRLMCEAWNGVFSSDKGAYQWEKWEESVFHWLQQQQRYACWRAVASVVGEHQMSYITFIEWGKVFNAVIHHEEAIPPKRA